MNMTNALYLFPNTFIILAPRWQGVCQARRNNLKNMKKISILIVALISFGSVNAQLLNPPTEGLQIGNLAPDIKLPNSDGKVIALSSLRGKVVLVDFWASWCRPCRMENPNVVAAYANYKDTQFKTAKGFTIYSVSLDKEKEAWMNAIKQDGLSWTTHVSDLKFWASDAARLYQVQGIPTNWLLDEKGVIIGKDLRGAALDQALESIKKN
jgi:peroxiredoxin